MAETSAIWTVPLARNAQFVGRIDLLKDLRQQLTSADPAGRVQVLTGAGGIGKTALAVEYAFEHRDAYKVVGWIRADDALTLQADLVKLGQLLHVAPDEKSPSAIVEALRGRLAGRADWLLILDHAANPELLADVLPREKTGHVIITSRDESWPGVRGLRVGALAREEAIVMLRKKLGSSAGSVLTISKLAQALQDVPLALEQASALMKHNKVTPEQFLLKFEQHWGELLQRGRNTTGYPDAVSMTWELSYRAAGEASQDATDFLGFCSFFAPSGIPIDMLEDGGVFLAEPISDIVSVPGRMDRALKVLTDFSLATVADERIYLQSVVQQLARRRMSTDVRRKYCKMAIRLSDAVFKFESGDIESWQSCAPLLPHVRAAVEHAITEDTAQETACTLLSDIGELLYEQARYSESKQLLEKAEKIGRRALSPESSRLRTIINNLGRVLSKLGEMAAAKKQLEDAVAREEKARGKNHPNVADLLNNLGGAMHKTGDYQKAKEAFQRALSIYDLHDISDQAKAASIINNLGYTFMKTGNLAGAKELYAKALKIAQAGYGQQHPDVAAILNNIGDLHFLKRDFESARSNYEKALRMDEAIYGADHPEVARHLGDLGRLMATTGNAAAGKRYLERALKIERATFGLRHPQVMARMKDLGKVMQALGEPGGSGLIEQATAARKESKRRSPATEQASQKPEKVDLFADDSAIPSPEVIKRSKDQKKLSDSNIRPGMFED